MTLTEKKLLEKLRAGDYASRINANRALGQLKTSPKKKESLRQNISDHFNAIEEIRKDEKHLVEEAKELKDFIEETKERVEAHRIHSIELVAPEVRRDTRITIMLSVMRDPRSRVLIQQLIEKSVKEGLSLLELHKELHDLDELLPRSEG